MKKIFLLILFIILIAFPFYWYYFGPVGKNKEVEIFIIPKNQDGFDLVQKLETEKFIKKIKLLNTISIHLFF